MKGLLTLIAKDVTGLGGMVFYVSVSLFCYFSGHAQLAYRLLGALVAILLFAYAIRTVYFKRRPDGQKYSSYFERLDASSFPSIHAARASALTVVLMMEFTSLPIRLMVLALWAMVLWSRLALKRHDPADVAGGLVLGTLLAFVTILVL